MQCTSSTKNKREKLKAFVFAHPKAVGTALKGYNAVRINNRIRTGKNNSLSYEIVKLNGVKITIKGAGNRVIIGDYAQLIDTVITIYGNDNVIRIGDRCKLNQADMYIEDSNNSIIIGEHTNIAGRTHLAAIESTEIRIGAECLFSSDIHFRTGDSHSIINEEGERINPSKNIVIGDHCWIGTRVTCLKGTEVADNTIVGAGSLLTKQYKESNCVLAGSPASVIKENVNWTSERI